MEQIELFIRLSLQYQPFMSDGSIWREIYSFSSYDATATYLYVRLFLSFFLISSLHVFFYYFPFRTPRVRLLSETWPHIFNLTPLHIWHLNDISIILFIYSTYGRYWWWILVIAALYCHRTVTSQPEFRRSPSDYE